MHPLERAVIVKACAVADHPDHAHARTELKAAVEALRNARPSLDDLRTALRENRKPYTIRALHSMDRAIARGEWDVKDAEGVGALDWQVIADTWQYGPTTRAALVAALRSLDIEPAWAAREGL
jgi:hypothetical protein